MLCPIYPPRGGAHIIERPQRETETEISHHSMPSLLRRVKSFFVPRLHDKKRDVPLVLAEKDDYLAMIVVLPSLAPSRLRRALRRYEYDSPSVSPVATSPVFPAVCIVGDHVLRSISLFVAPSVCFLKPVLLQCAILRVGRGFGQMVGW